ncbi:MAG: single-stranded-DNA-specific exonuclease RecJ [Bdellovibrionales bacterium GWA2_49_15]|nr:MAG: single-stranded-DNA-specific exonuclease RecJ [Bdellovibrionales bacterium GWA2_49_15]HAZ12934.1 single-stranded-DNA-specific exonuclease RecJ [Bdellovibrionales bacterium]
MQPQTTSHPQIDLHPTLLALLERRGYKGAQGVAEFLSWDLKRLSDLSELKDLSKAAQRVVLAVAAGEKIGIYGDYDVDGTTACALLYFFFKMLNIPVELIQPSRFVEGYGIHPSNIDAAVKRDIKVLITVDCGITAHDAALRAREVNLDLIITDHHKEAKEGLPVAFAVINPNRSDEAPDSPLKSLAGVAVAFCLALEIKKILEGQGKVIPSLYPLLQFVAIGTICDLAPMTPNNLKLVRHGLKQMADSCYSGLRSFFTPEERAAGKVLSEKCGFYIGPMINSKGRLEHPEKALELLIAEDSDRAFLCYNQLDISNRERKMIQAGVFELAREQMIRELEGDDPVASIAYSADWHEGVIGIVASKLVDTFKVPAIVFTNAQEEGLLKGSARSAGDLNIFEILQKLSHHFVRFGGHKAAAGMSLKKENLSAFTQEFKKILRTLPPLLRTESETFDLEVKAHEIGAKLARDLEMLEPFGNGNERPTFRVRDLKIESYELMKDVHVKWSLVSKSDPTHHLKGVSFNYIGKWQAIHPEEIFKTYASRPNAAPIIDFELGINRWKGKEFVQLQIKHIQMEC